MKISFRLLYALLFTCVYQAHANDGGASGVGGRWRLLKAEHHSIQMVREYILIDGKAPYEFRTTADFVFRNHGRAQWVTMGFPDEGYGVDSERGSTSPSLLQKFQSWVDGKRVKVRFHRTTSEPNGEESLGLWTKRVWFGSSQTRHIRVSYVSQNGGGDSSGYQWVAYDFTSGNWRGKVLQSVLDVRFPPDAEMIVDAFHTAEEKGAIKPRVTVHGRTFRFVWRNWQAEQEWTLLCLPLLPNDLNRPDAAGWRNAWLLKSLGRGLPVRDDNGAAISQSGLNALLLHGHLWVRAGWLGTTTWDVKRHGVSVESGHRSTFFPASGAQKNTKRWPLNPRLPIWAGFSGSAELFVPGQAAARNLGLRFVVNRKKGLVRWEKSSREADYFRLK